MGKPMVMMPDQGSAGELIENRAHWKLIKSPTFISDMSMIISESVRQRLEAIAKLEQSAYYSTNLSAPRQLREFERASNTPLSSSSSPTEIRLNRGVYVFALLCNSNRGNSNSGNGSAP